jgi:AcrR family transcriptional regulator
MTTTARTRNPRGSGTRLREEIIDASIGLIDETNDASTLTLRGIARRADITAPSIYSHFADLPAVIEAVLAESFAQLKAIVEEAIATENDPARALEAAGAAYVQFGWDHRARYRLMFAATGYSNDAVQIFTLVEDAIARCVAAGESESSDPRIDAYLLWVAMHGIATLEKPGRADYLRLGPLDRPAMLQTIITRLARLADPRLTNQESARN